MTTQNIATTCCVVGGGPAGIMLGYLLARQGVRTTVIEKHADFFRDFRGDTVHPSTLDLFHELGLLDDFLKRPHQQLQAVTGIFGDFEFRAVDFRRVPAHCKFVALMPQWDFLDFLSRHARKLPNFDLRMRHEAVGLTYGARRITGVEARTPDGTVQIQADLVVGCDGRDSIARKSARLEVQEFGVPIDVAWFRISRRAGDPEQLFGNVNYGRALVLINRGDYFQAGLIIEKGSLERLKTAGLDALRETIAKIAPYLRDRVGELRDWDQIKLLTVKINRLRQWHRPGLLCIGDAAHAMSPAWGVGINLAIQDAVAAANLLARPLQVGRADESLALVQRRREFPTRAMQFLQLIAHRGFGWVFRHPGPIHAPWQLKLVSQVPGLQRVMGHIVGIGFRPEHIVPARRRSSLVRKIVGFATAVAVAGVYLTRKSQCGAATPGRQAGFRAGLV
jgi:2-polyprenyl-6-methoxyphenol hydroxylase-like FAD-dependent oxidoreductase